MALSALIQQDRQIYRGQTAAFVITVTEDKERFNLSGHTLFLHVKNKIDDVGFLLILQTGSGITHRDQTVESPTEGQADAIMTSGQTATFSELDNIFDLWLEKSGGDKEPIVPPSKLIVNTPVGTP